MSSDTERELSTRWRAVMMNVKDIIQRSTEVAKISNITTSLRHALGPKIIDSLHRYIDRVDEMVNNAATIHITQIVATTTHHAACEETRTCKRFTVILYFRMLSTAKDYAERPTDRRRQKGSSVHRKSPSSRVSDILFAQDSKKMTSAIFSVFVFCFTTFLKIYFIFSYFPYLLSHIFFDERFVVYDMLRQK